MITHNNFISETPKFPFRFMNMGEKAVEIRVSKEEFRDKYEKNFLALMEARGVIVNCAVEIERLLELSGCNGGFDDKIKQFSDLVENYKSTISQHWDIDQIIKDLNDFRKFRNDLAHGSMCVNEKDEYYVENKALRRLTKEEFNKYVKISNELFFVIPSINELIKMAKES